MSTRTEAHDAVRRAQMAQVLGASPRTGPPASADRETPTLAAAPGPVGLGGRRSGRTTPMRLSVDLAPVAYQRLAVWVTEAGSDLGQRVTHVGVFRALLEELLLDPDLQRRVLGRLGRRS